MTTRRGCRAGFTLLEVLVAMTVLLIGITGVTALFTHGLGMARSGEENAYAAQLGRSVRDALAVAMSAPLKDGGAVYWVNFVHDGVGVGTWQMTAGAGNVGIPQYPFPLPRVRGDVRHHPGNQPLNSTTLAQQGSPDGGMPGVPPGGNQYVSPFSAGNPFRDEIFRMGATPAPAGAEVNVWQNPLYETIKDVRGAPVQSLGSINVVPPPTDLTLDYGLYWYDFLVEGDFAAAAPPALAKTYLFTVRVFRGEYAAGQWINAGLGAPVATMQFPLAAMD